MSSSALSPINADVRARVETPRTEVELKEALHKAILKRDYILAEELSAQLMEGRSTLDTYICNITDKEFGPLDMWHYMPGVVIPPRKSGEKYSIYKVTPHTDHMDMGDNRSLAVPIPSYDCAVDICDKFNGHMGRNSYAGVFVIQGGRSVPTDAELVEADAKLLTWDKLLINEGDRYFDIKRTADISDLHRDACRRRGLKKAWLPEQQLAAQCHACGTDIRAGIALCPQCGVILDSEKYSKLHFAGQPVKEAVKAVLNEEVPSVFEDEDSAPIEVPKLRQR